MSNSNFQRYIDFRDSLWEEFEKLVQNGAKFRISCDVRYVHGINPEGMSVDSEGRSWFIANELIANSKYKIADPIHGKDLLMEYNHVEFIDIEGIRHKLEPDLHDISWCAELLDAANGLFWENGIQHSV